MANSKKPKDAKVSELTIYNDSLESKYFYQFRIIQLLEPMPNTVYVVQYREESETAWNNYPSENLDAKGERNGNVVAYKTLKEAETFVEGARKKVEYLLVREY